MIKNSELGPKEPGLSDSSPVALSGAALSSRTNEAELG